MIFVLLLPAINRSLEYPSGSSAVIARQLSNVGFHPIANDGAILIMWPNQEDGHDRRGERDLAKNQANRGGGEDRGRRGQHE